MEFLPSITVSPCIFLFIIWLGISASLLRQLTYSTTRFGVYETLKKQFPSDQPLPFYQKAFLAGLSGALGGLVGTPGDLINVRMQNDVKVGVVIISCNIS